MAIAFSTPRSLQGTNVPLVALDFHGYTVYNAVMV